MEMEYSLKQSLDELINLQRQQLMKMNESSQAQAVQGMQGYTQNPYAHYSQPYNTNFMPPGLNPFNNLQPSFNQFQSYAGTLASKPGQFGFLDVMGPGSSQVSPQVKDMMRNDYANRFSNAAVSGAGALGSAGATFGAYGLGLGWIGGAAAGMAGGAAVGAFFDNGVEQMKVGQAYDKYLERESYRFINARESTNQRDIGGFDREQRQQAADFLRKVNTDFFIEDDEMMRLTQSYTESGLLRDVNDLESFKERIETLTKSVRTGALILNETYESISALMGDMRKMGIDSKDFTGLMSMGKISGMELGMSGSEALRLGLDMANQAVAGTGISAQHYATRVMESQMYMGHMFDQLQGSDNLTAQQQAALNFINNAGGVEGAAGRLNSAQDQFMNQEHMALAAGFDYNESTGAWSMNRQRFGQVMSGQLSRGEIVNIAEQNLLASGDFGTKNWMENYTNYLGNNLSHTDLNAAMIAMARGTNMEIGANPNDIAGGLATLMPGMDAHTRTMLVQQMEHAQMYGTSIMERNQNLAWAQNMMAETQAGIPTIRERFSAGWENIKEGAADPFVRFGNFASGKIEDIHDRITGRPLNRMNFSSTLMPEIRDSGLTTGQYMEDLMGEISNSLSGLKSQGFNVSDDLIGSFDTGRDMSDSILEALRKFSNTPEADKLFGAHESIKKMIDPKSTPDEALSQVADILAELKTSYGGNQELATKAFFMGQDAVDAQLKAMGYDIDKLRSTGQQSQLQGVNVSNITNNNYEHFRTATGYNVTGEAWTEDNPLYQPGYGFTTKKNIEHAWKDHGGWAYDDLMYEIGDITGVSANLLATLASIESSGRPDAMGDNGDSYGMFQIQPKWGHHAEYVGHEFTASGKSWKIGSHGKNAEEELMIPEIAAYIAANLIGDRVETYRGNTNLAYLSYNAGDDHAMNVTKHLKNNMGYGDNWGNAGWEDVAAAASAIGLNTAAANMRNWGPAYLEGMIIPDAPPPAQDIILDALAPEIVTIAALRERIGAPEDPTRIYRQDHMGELNDIIDQQRSPESEPWMVRHGTARPGTDVPFDTDRFVDLYTEMHGLQDKTRGNILLDMKERHKSVYDSMSGEDPEWNKLNPIEKLETLRMMQAIESVPGITTGRIKEHPMLAPHSPDRPYDTLSPVEKIGRTALDFLDPNIKGGDLYGVFTTEDMEYLRHIYPDMTFKSEDRGDVLPLGKLFDYTAEGRTAYDSFSKEDMGKYTAAELEEKFQKEMREMEEQQKKSGELYAELTTEIGQMKLLSLTKETRDDVQKAVLAGDAGTIEKILSSGPHSWSKSTDTDKLKAWLEAYHLDQGVDLSGIKGKIETVGQMPKVVAEMEDLAKVFNDRFGLSVVSDAKGMSEKEIAEEFTLGELSNISDSIHLGIKEGLIPKLQEDLEGVMELLPSYLPGALDKAGLFEDTMDGPGYQIKAGKEEEVAQAVISAIAQTIEGAVDEDKIKDSTKTLEDGANDLASAVNRAGETFATEAKTLNARLDEVEGGPGRRWWEGGVRDWPMFNRTTD